MNLIKSVGFGVVAVAAMFVSSSAFAARDYGGTGRTRGVKLAYDPSTGIVSATRGGMLMIFK